MKQIDDYTREELCKVLSDVLDRHGRSSLIHDIVALTGLPVERAQEIKDILNAVNEKYLVNGVWTPQPAYPDGYNQLKS